MEIYERFKHNVENNAMVEENDRILLSLSGGADSVFLFYMLLKLQTEISFNFSCFHLNHNLRVSAKRDEDFCIALCKENNIILHNFSCDIAQKAKTESLGTEAAARKQRYDLIEDLRNNYAYNKVFTAHHANDNAETVLMHIIRGSGVDGLIGIRPINGYLMRPILIFSKDEIRAYLKENCIQNMEDETNDSTDYFRNRVRIELLPMLKKENPAIVTALCRLSTSANDYEQAVNEIAEVIPLTHTNEAVFCDYSEFLNASKAVKYKCLNKMFRSVGIFKDITYANFDAVNALVLNVSNTLWRCDVPGAVVYRSRDKLFVAKKMPECLSEEKIYTLNVPSVNIFCLQGMLVRLSIDKNFKKNMSDKYIKAIDYDKIKDNIFLRTFNTSDRFIPLGMKQEKRLSRYFIDNKLLKEEKSSTPILADGEKIIAVLGYTIDDRVKITSQTKNILVIEYRKWEQ